MNRVRIRCVNKFMEMSVSKVRGKTIVFLEFSLCEFEGCVCSNFLEVSGLYYRILYRNIFFEIYQITILFFFCNKFFYSNLSKILKRIFDFMEFLRKEAFVGRYSESRIDILQSFNKVSNELF